MRKLSDVIELAEFSLNVTHGLKDGTIVHAGQATYHFPTGTIEGPIEIDIEPAPGVTIIVTGADVSPK